MINIIVARDKYRVIGVDGDLPEWHLKSDMNRFRELTTGNVVVMGRATYESIGRPLPNRKNVVVSTGLQNAPKGVKVAKTYRDAIAYAKKYANKHNCDIYIIGGQSIYDLALRNDNVDNILMTLVNGEFEGDTYFPSIPIDQWRLNEYEIHSKDNNNTHDFAYMNFVKRRPGEGYNVIFYYPSSRSEDQTQKMREIENLGICPFCEDWLEWYHDSPILHRSEHWVVTPNDNPYKNTAMDLLLISKHHCINFRNLPEAARLDLGNVIAWVENNCGINYFGLGMRVGPVDKVAGSINHLHAHIKVGDVDEPNHKPVTFKMSSRPEVNKPPENY
jgi:dihydrofolate reductase